MFINNIIIFIITFVAVIKCHTYNIGECKPFELVNNFDIRKLLGRWYVIQKTESQASCLVYNITDSGDSTNDSQYFIEQISQHYVEGTQGAHYLKYLTSYTGELNVTSWYDRNLKKINYDMTIKYPFNFAGGSSFTVFMTDYARYAVIYTCQRIFFFHRQSIAILSRSKSIEPAVLRDIYSRLDARGIDLFKLNSINQLDDECLDVNQQEIFIRVNPEFISTINIFNKVKTAAENSIDNKMLNYTMRNIENVLTSIIQPLNITMTNNNYNNLSKPTINTGIKYINKNPSDNNNNKNNKAIIVDSPGAPRDVIQKNNDKHPERNNNQQQKNNKNNNNNNNEDEEDETADDDNNSTSDNNESWFYDIN